MAVRLGGAALAVAMGMAGLARAAEPPPPLPTVAEQVRIARAEERGRTIYAYDQAAWHSTDEMLRKVPKEAMPTRGGGWVVEPHGDLLRVIYYGTDGGAPLAFFRADMRGSEVADSHVYAAGEDRALTADELRLVHARDAAWAAASAEKKTLCTNGRPNFVVLPPAAADAPTPVYLLTAMVKTGEYPVGGHYEFDISPDGKVASERAFTKACLNMGEPPAGTNGQPAAMVVTHFLDPTPTEIHVFISLWSGKPILVVTAEGRVWGAQDGRIVLLKILDAPK